jgi:NDP-sugar pyrophosphorylase family protein
MHGLVLAAGSGSRLVTSGLVTPKPFLEVGARTLVDRTVAMLDELGVTSLTCLVREEHAAATATLVGARARIIPCATPSSLHTLALGFAALPPGPVFCALVDSVMRVEDWRRIFAVTAADLGAGADAVLAVTPFADDERPLYVARGPGGRVVRVSETPVLPVCVTGGVFGFGDEARMLAADLVRRGRSRLRSLLTLMVTLGLDVTSTMVERIVDVDRRSDLDAARALLSSERGIW